MCVTNITDLGITISNNLSRELHIKKICAKANKILCLVKRVCGSDIIGIRIRKLLYVSLVRPILEYASNIWSPYTVKHRHLIENVQRRATKFILNYPRHDITKKNRLESLDMLPLEFRRVISDLILLFKYIELVNLMLTSVNFLHLLGSEE